jgi:outer membrane protein assembly factor BamB
MRLVQVLLSVLVGVLLLPACAPAVSPPPTQVGEVPGATITPTESPWQTGTPAPLLAPLTGTCPGGNDVQADAPDLRYGINTFMFATDRERVLSLTNIGGFGWVRQQIHWRDLEGERGQFVWKPLDQIVSAARAHDLDIMLSVVRSPAWATADGSDGLPDDPATLATFLHAVATRYKGRVAAYQVWNEPNLAHEGGGVPVPASDYLAVLEAAYPAIKDADPCALVVSAALASTISPDPAVASEDLPYFEQLYTLNDGVFLQAADVVALHPGAGPYPPAARWPADQQETSHHYFRHIERVRDLMQRHNDPRPVWITEYGWTVTTAEGAPPPVTEEQQATYLVDALWYVRQRYPWVGAIFVWNLNFSVIAPPTDEKTTFSILNPDWSIRPAFLLLQNNVGALRDVERAPFVPAAASHSYQWTFPARGQVQSTPLLAPDGTVYVVSAPGTLYALDPAGKLRWNFDAPGAVSATPARAPDGSLYLGNSGSLLTALAPDGALRWEARLDSPAHGSPVYLTDRIAIVSSVGTVYAFDTSGQELWRYSLESESTALTETSDGALLVVDATGTATKLDREGAVIWRMHLGGEFWSAPVANDAGGAYVVTVAGRVLALGNDGTLNWSYDLGAPVVASPLVGNDGRLYIAAQDGTLSALDAASGALRWQYNAGAPLAAPPAQDSNSMLYLGTDDERLLVIGPDGNRRWQVQVRGMVRAQPALDAGGRLYVPTTAGRLYAFVP